MSENGCHENLAEGGGRHKLINVNKIMNTCCTAIVLFDMDVAIYSLYEHI